MTRTICVVVPHLLLLPVLCEHGIDLKIDLFTHYNQMMQWSAAQAYCRRYHTDLVTIKTETENQKLFTDQGWIGLNRDNSKGPWRWSRTKETANFTSWDDGEPKPNNNCAYKANNTLQWDTDNCNATHTFNCYDETLLVTESKTWEEALSYCRSLEAVDPSHPATDYNNNCFDLATVITQDDYSSAREKIIDATTDEVWIGLRYMAGQWMWAGGEKAQYEDTGSCRAQEFCGIVVKNGPTAVTTRNCQMEMNFVCYKKP